MAAWEKELYTAVTSNNLASLQSILARDEVKRNGNLGRKEWGDNNYPFQYAAYQGREEMVIQMIDAGFDINSTGVNAFTAGNAADAKTNTTDNTKATNPTLICWLDIG